VGVPFREAHHAVGGVVKVAEQKGVPLDRLTHAEVQKVHAKFGPDWIESFHLDKAMARRRGTGMPGPAQLKRQFARWKKLLG